MVYVHVLLLVSTTVQYILSHGYVTEYIPVVAVAGQYCWQRPALMPWPEPAVGGRRWPGGWQR